MLMRPNTQSKNELVTLCNFCGITKESVIVEIGSYAGESSAIFANLCKTIYCVDPWIPLSMEGIDWAEGNFDLLSRRHPEIVKCKAFSTEYAQTVPDGSVDLVYIDGKHTEEAVREDIIAWRPKVKPGHWIGGHDYSSIFPGVVAAVDDLLGKPDKTFEYFSWVKKL